MKDSLESCIRLKGRFTVTLFGPDGRIKSRQSVDNLVVNAGRVRVIALLDGDAVNVPAYLAIGTSNTAAAASQTALVGTELARSTVITPTKEASNYTLRLSHTFAAGTGTGTVNEVGVFCDSSTGTMFARAVLGSAVDKQAGDSLAVTYDLSYAAG